MLIATIFETKTAKISNKRLLINRENQYQFTFNIYRHIMRVFLALQRHLDYFIHEICNKMSARF